MVLGWDAQTGHRRGRRCVEMRDREVRPGVADAPRDYRIRIVTDNKHITEIARDRMCDNVREREALSVVLCTVPVRENEPLTGTPVPPTGVAVGPTLVPLPGDRGPDTARTTAHTAQPQGQGHGALVRSADEDTLTS